MNLPETAAPKFIFDQDGNRFADIDGIPTGMKPRRPIGGDSALLDYFDIFDENHRYLFTRYRSKGNASKVAALAARPVWIDWSRKSDREKWDHAASLSAADRRLFVTQFLSRK